MTITYLTGPMGSGKTTYGMERLRTLLQRGVPATSILVLLPQLTLASPYRQLLQESGAETVEILTMSGLATKMIDLFWPLLATGSLRFGRPQARPVFLNVEAAQYYFQQAVDPLLKQGYFDPNVVPVAIPWPRLIVQMLDNLNKAALMGLPHTEVGQRLALSLASEAGNRVALEHAQICMNRFREFCLARNLLDFSLRVETFYQHLWPVTGVRQFMINSYRHLIVDNLEEDNAFSHATLTEWLPRTESALLIHDEDAGFRILLGANWRTAQKLADLADERLHFNESYVAPAPMLQLGERLSGILKGNRADKSPSPTTEMPFTFEQRRFYPQIVEWVVDRIVRLIEEGVSPNQIVVLAPLISEALHFSLVHRLEQKGVAVQAHRPSRPLSEEPVIKTMLILARLAFPHWNLLPEPADVAQALSRSIGGLDLVRADLLTQVVYRQVEREQGVLTSFGQIDGVIRWRVSEPVGERFDVLRDWLQGVQAAETPPALDQFFSRLFEEVLSQPDFGFHHQPEAGEIVTKLVDSARRFREVAEQVPVEVQAQPGIKELGVTFPQIDQVNRAYVEMMEQDMVAAQYLPNWEPAPEGAISLMPVTTFLMSNRPVDYQFWLDAGSHKWWEGIAQPLTHPYVLAADWEAGRPWTDADEVAAQHDWLSRVLLGLTRRCRKHIFITNSEVSEQGYEQRGPLLTTLQRLLRQAQQVSVVS